MATTRKPAAVSPSAPVPSPKAPPGGLTPLELTALAIVGKEAKKWRGQLVEGCQQPFDVIIHLQGTIDVGGAQTSTVREKPDPETLLAKMFTILGPKGRQKHAAALLDPYSSLEPDAEAVTLAKTVLESLTTPSPQNKAGNVTGQITIGRVG